MKFYINGRIVTSKEIPLILILSKQDKENISNMKPKVRFYCEFNTDTHTQKEISDLLTKIEKLLG